MLEIATLSNVKEYSEKMAQELMKVFVGHNVKGKAVGDGEFEVIATTSGVDRDGEVIQIEAWDTENFMKNPVVLFGHDYWSLPIGIVTALEVQKGQIVAKGIFAKTEEAQKVRQLYDDGILKAVSVGFIVKNRDAKNPLIITGAELLELSFVPVPANADALSLSKMTKAIKHFDALQKAEDQTIDIDSLVADLRSGLEGVVDAFVENMAGNEEEDQEDEDTEEEPAKPDDQAEPVKSKKTQYELDQGAQCEAIKIMDDFFLDVKARYTAAKADIKALGVKGKESSTKEGRVLSAKNRGAIENAIKVLAEILTLAEPEKAAHAETLKGIKELLQSMDKLGEKAIVEVKKALE